jgi:hypothetical protein
MERKEGPSPKETANSVGYVVGFVFGKKLVFDRVLIQLIRKIRFKKIGNIWIKMLVLTFEIFRWDNAFSIQPKLYTLNCHVCVILESICGSLDRNSYI